MQQQGVSFGALMPHLRTLVTPEQSAQLNDLYIQMKRDSISRGDFVRGARVIAGERVIMDALHLLQSNASAQSEDTSSSDVNSTAVSVSHPPDMMNTPSLDHLRKPFVPLPQKKPPETFLTQPPSKKQKAGNDPVQSIDQINDVTAVGGVNLREEEEQLLTGPREESRTTAEMRRKVLDEEGRFFLEKGPLHAKVSAIAAKHGIKVIGEDVERCLSMSAEERLWCVMLKLVKLSKQRCDVEKERHRVMQTSDIQKQINVIRKKQKDIVQRKQAEENERLRKLNEEKGASEDKEGASKKAQEDDKMRTTAAARKAIGGDDMLMKWQMMAEQGRQRREGGSGMELMSGPGRPDIGMHAAATAAAAAAAAASLARPSEGAAVIVNARRSLLPKPGRTITIKDVTACLEGEQQMSKSLLLYRFYQKIASDDPIL